VCRSAATTEISNGVHRLLAATNPTTAEITVRSLIPTAIIQNGSGLFRLVGFCLFIIFFHLNTSYPDLNLTTKSKNSRLEGNPSALPLLEGREVSISASIGVAIYPDDGTDVDTLVSRADKAMYEAKQRGHNAYSHSPQNVTSET
jgi:GGDEF domain-containing protein